MHAPTHPNLEPCPTDSTSAVATYQPTPRPELPATTPHTYTHPTHTPTLPPPPRCSYLEFNLLYDRGVKFGLDGGRVESIMVSAPPLIAWKYNVQPEEGSPEGALVELLRQPREWA